MAEANYMFKVRNDEEGRFFIHSLRKNAQNGTKFLVRGRHSDRQGLKKKGVKLCWGHEDVPLKHAEFLCVYAQIVTTHQGSYGTYKSRGTFGPRSQAMTEAERIKNAGKETENWLLRRSLKNILASATQAVKDLD